LAVALAHNMTAALLLVAVLGLVPPRAAANRD
jgi:heme A synthase